LLIAFSDRAVNRFNGTIFFTRFYDIETIINIVIARQWCTYCQSEVVPSTAVPSTAEVVPSTAIRGSISTSRIYVKNISDKYFDRIKC
jgi:hypothetical protein